MWSFIGSVVIDVMKLHDIWYIVWNSVHVEIATGIIREQIRTNLMSSSTFEMIEHIEKELSNEID